MFNYAAYLKMCETVIEEKLIAPTTSDPHTYAYVHVCTAARVHILECRAHMACVDKLREELMESLGIGVERKRSSPPSVANPRRDLIGSARRDRTSRCGSSSSSRGMVEYPQNARRLQQQPLTQQQEHYETGGRRSSSTHDRRVGEKYARPGGMNLRATSNNRSSGRGGVTGGGARPATASSARSIKRTEIDVLMEICRDQGRGFSLDPADFDSR